MKFSELKAVNSEFNQYTYETEIGDDWTPIDLTLDKEDDCDSYATAKAERLIKMGWSKSALRIGFCRTETGGGHLVLLVDFEGQTYVLDNRFALPMEYQLLSYTWIGFGHIDTGKWEMAK
jgi:predicted transglutaminase-like cysteine proteinase